MKDAYYEIYIVHVIEHSDNWECLLYRILNYRNLTTEIRI